MSELRCVNGHDRCYLGPDPDCPYCERVSKYAAKGKRPYRYSFAGCDHRETYMDRYAVPDGEFRKTFYTVKRCKACDLILGEPRVER